MTRKRLMPAERRELNRLRSLRWRRAHGIGPRKPAERPWLALGISRSLVPPACESPRAGRTGETVLALLASAGRERGGARPLAVADCGAAHEPRSMRGCACGDGDGAELGGERFL